MNINIDKHHESAPLSQTGVARGVSGGMLPKPPDEPARAVGCERASAVDQRGRISIDLSVTRAGSRTTATKCALYGFLLVSLAFAVYVGGVALGPLRWLFLDPPLFRKLNAYLIWYSGIPLVIGALLIWWDLWTKVRPLRSVKSVRKGQRHCQDSGSSQRASARSTS